ncbi:MAG: TonB-dependent receptor [Hyphomonadaceae bacterium]
MLGALPAAGQTRTDPDRDTVVVIGVVPLGDDVAMDQVAAAAVRLGPGDLARNGSPDLLGALDRKIGGLMLNQAQGNPFQPNVIYRGFEASPLQGNAQGIAVYLDGARFNQAFGDTVDWDLIPSIAIEQVDVIAANPAFGLNALGGALNVKLKRALGLDGASISMLGGSFGRASASAEAGASVGGVSFYGAVSALEEDGWRYASPSSLRQAYGDFGWQDERAEYHLSLIAARNDLTGNGASPVELLAADRSAVFTYPDRTQTEYARLSFAGDWTLNDTWRLRARAYGGRLDRKSMNGDAAEVEPCEDEDDELCAEDGETPLTDINGDEVPNFITGSDYADEFPDFAEGGPYAFLNHADTGTSSWGVSATLSGETSLVGLGHTLSIGASLDEARTHFTAGSDLGGLALDRGWFGPGIALDTPDAGINPVSVSVDTSYSGLFASDAIALAKELTLTLAVRGNIAKIQLTDRIGTDLNGDHTFRRLNPSAGLAWRATPDLTIYGGYAETNRTPTPAELSCADPASPCSLANFFVADPPLHQVVARTWEAGVRGNGVAGAGATYDWRLGAYRADVDDDIQMVASGVPGRGYFTNVGKTRREGVEAGALVSLGWTQAFVEYAWTRATYRTSFDLNAGANPAFEDEDDIMTVEPGNRRPGIPEHVVKAGVDFDLPWNAKLGFDAIWSSGRYLLGDEANLNAKTDSYTLANAYLRAPLSKSLEAFVQVENLFDTDYETFGAFAPVEEVPIFGLAPLEDPRSLSPGAPRAVFVGFRFTL